LAQTSLTIPNIPGAIGTAGSLIANFQDIIGVSDLNTPMYDNLVFVLKEDNETDVVLTLNAVQFVITQPKNIVRTKVSGRNGSIKEYNSDDDYIVRGTAKLTNPDGRLFPEQPLNTFVRVAKAQSEVDIISKILNNNFRIDSVVLLEFIVAPSTGAGDVRVDFVLLSDTPFDVKEFLVI
jgi:hypothetical protein